MNKRIIVAAVASAALMAAHLVAADVEVLHWWTSGGEAKSVAELKKMPRSQGPQVEGFCGGWWRRRCRDDSAQRRVVSGNPPTAAQIKAVDSGGLAKARWVISATAKEWGQVAAEKSSPTR